MAVRSEQAREIEQRITKDVKALVASQKIGPKQAEAIADALYGVAILVAEYPVDVVTGDCESCGREWDAEIGADSELALELSQDRLVVPGYIQQQVCRRVA